MKADIPEDKDEKFEWILEQERKLDLFRGENWVTDEMKFLWENPKKFEAGVTQNAPESVRDEDYLLFRLGVLFGVDYEHYYPRESDDWR